MSLFREQILFSLAVLNSCWLRVCGRKNLRIVLYYHSVLDSQRDGFAEQMRYLADTCCVVRLEEIFDAEPEDGQNVVAITFDDAFCNLMYNALPVLDKLGLPCSIFVPSGRIGGVPDWDIAEEHIDKTQRIMSSEQLKTIAAGNVNVDLYSHTVSHPRLTEIDDERLRKEVHESRRRLELLLGRTVDVISYPHGVYDERVLREVERAGYRYGFTIQPEVLNGHHRLALPRFVVSPDDSMLKFKLIVSGAYEVDSTLRKIKSKVMK